MLPHSAGRGGHGSGAIKHQREPTTGANNSVNLTTAQSDEEGEVKEVEWDGEHVGEWINCLDGAEAVVNLAGRNINCRHTPENLREITESRVNPVRAIAAAIGQVKQPPRVWVQAGAVGFYGDCGDQWCDETTPNGRDSLAEVCRLWEQAFHAADSLHTRRVLFRIGLVLGRDGGALPVLANLTRWFLGGAAGNGKQYISWIQLADLMQMFLQAIEPGKLSGRHLQRRCAQSGNQCGIHARAPAQLLSSVVPAGSRLGGKGHIPADSD